MDVSVYRIVQEALTNARKHAGGAATTLEVELYPLDTVFAGDVMFDVEHAPQVLRAERDQSR